MFYLEFQADWFFNNQTMALNLPPQSVPIATLDEMGESASQALLLDNISKYEGKHFFYLFLILFLLLFDYLLYLIVYFFLRSFKGPKREKRCTLFVYNFGCAEKSQKENCKVRTYRC